MDDNIHNWYEKLVMAKLSEQLAEGEKFSEDEISDIACIALNHLPPRYVRHSVDMSFYTSPQEREEMDQRIDAAISHAVDRVSSHPYH
ncbi:MAG: late competence development ComFB family protein [Pseudomonadales bacterium]|nr:late competence development ComFB family protein [Pseudomonadales bacterium]